MKTSLMRKIHYWISPFVMIPFFIMTITGVVLMYKKQSSWVQPPTKKGVGKAPEVAFQTILDTLQAHEELKVKGWESVDRIDVRPGKGVSKVRLKNRTEVQIDSKTGSILQIAERRSDLIEDMHTGAFWSDWVKDWIFLPTGYILIILNITGIVLFFVLLPPRIKQLKKK